MQNLNALLPKLTGKLQVDSPSIKLNVFLAFCSQGIASRNISLISRYLRVNPHILKYIKSVFTDSSSFFLMQHQASYDFEFHQHVQTSHHYLLYLRLSVDKLQTLQAPCMYSNTAITVEVEQDS